MLSLAAALHRRMQAPRHAVKCRGRRPALRRDSVRFSHDLRGRMKNMRYPTDFLSMRTFLPTALRSAPEGSLAKRANGLAVEGRTMVLQRLPMPLLPAAGIHRRRSALCTGALSR